MNMKKITVLLAFVAFILASPKAQSQTFDKGDNVLNLTVGFGSTIFTGGYNQRPAVAVALDHCFWGDLINGDFSIGMGGYLGMGWSHYSYRGSDYNYIGFLPGVRGNFHWTGVENLDLYAGLLTGARLYNGDYDRNYGYAEPHHGVYTNAYVGARYYFSDTFCVLGELGAGVTYANVGIGFKF